MTRQLVTDDTANRIGAGFGAAIGFVLVGGISLAASGWIVGNKYGTEEGDSEQAIIGVLGAAIGSVVGAVLGVPSEAPSPTLPQTGVQGEWRSYGVFS